jgi:hypothetical protein
VATRAALKGLTGLVQQANMPAFKAATSLLGIGHQKEALWSDLANLNTGATSSSESFDLPPFDVDTEVPHQSVTLIDDTKTASTVVLESAPGLKISDFRFRLHAHPGAYEFPPDTAVATPDGKVRLTFPSLAALGLKEPKLELRSFYARDTVPCDEIGGASPKETSPQHQRPHAVAYVKRVKPDDPAVSLKSGAKVVRANRDAKGELDVRVEAKNAAKQKLTITGATVEAVYSGATLIAAFPGPVFEVTPGSLRLALSNLDPAVAVVVAAEGAAPIEARVVEAVARRKEE